MTAQYGSYTDGFASDVNSLLFDGWVKGETTDSRWLVDVYTGNMTGGTFTQLDHKTYANTNGITTYTELTGTLAVHHGTGTDFTNYVKIFLTATVPTVYYDDISLKTVGGRRTGYTRAPGYRADRAALLRLA